MIVDMNADDQGRLILEWLSGGLQADWKDTPEFFVFRLDRRSPSCIGSSWKCGKELLYCWHAQQISDHRHIFGAKSVENKKQDE